jgi:putative NADH-flavin reductase
MLFLNFIKRIMQKNIKIAVIGGTGKSGKYLVQHLLRQGYAFKMLVRNAEAVPIERPLVGVKSSQVEVRSPLVEVSRPFGQVNSPLNEVDGSVVEVKSSVGEVSSSLASGGGSMVQVIQGDARDDKAVHSLIEGCQAVISTLGQPKGEPPIFSAATENVIRAMTMCGIKRYILTTGLNVDTAFDKKGTQTAMATEWMRANYPLTTADKQRELDLLLQSDIDWTLVRLPLIELTDEVRGISVSLADCPGEKINAGSLADFLVRQLGEEGYVRRAPFIANG